MKESNISSDPDHAKNTLDYDNFCEHKKLVSELMKQSEEILDRDIPKLGQKAYELDISKNLEKALGELCFCMNLIERTKTWNDTRDLLKHTKYVKKACLELEKELEFIEQGIYSFQCFQLLL